MKKIITIALLITVLFAAGFADLVEQAKAKAVEINKNIEVMNLKWTAGSNTEYVEKCKYEIDDLDAFYSKLNGANEPIKALRELIHGNANTRMNFTYDLWSSAITRIFPQEQPESSFYRLEPVKDQYLYGSCWAFSTLGAFESARAVQVLGLPEGNVNNVLDYSERWVAAHNVELMDGPHGYSFQDKDELSGGWASFALFNSIRYGVMEEAAAPYSQVYISNLENIPLPPTAYGAPRIHSSKMILIPETGYEWPYAQEYGYSYDEYINMVKTAIKNYGSLSYSFKVPVDFNAYSKGIYSPVITTLGGGHAVTLVGWAAVSDLDDIVLAEKTNPAAQPILDEEIQEYTYYDPFAEATKTTNL